MHSRIALPMCLALIATRLASADCATDFAADNAVKPGAGAFRVTSFVRTTTEMGGKQYPMGDGRTIVEVVPPASLYLRNELPMDTSEVAIVDGKEGWRREDGEWSPLDPAQVRSLATDPDLRRYFAATNLRDLACLGESAEEGRTVRTYRYTFGDTTLPVQVTAHFDAKTGLPNSGATDNRIGKTQSHTVMTFEFDGSIAIARPR